MKRITKVFFVLCVCAVSLSCSKDDDFSPENYEKNIIGEWEKVYEYYWEHTEGRDPTETEHDMTDKTILMMFKENGLVKMKMYYPSWNAEDEKAYKIINDRIVINDDYETSEKILSLTQKELKTEVHFMDVNGNRPQEVYYLNTYERQ